MSVPSAVQRAPARHEYHLTEAGRELFPVTLALQHWGDKWAVESPAITRRHTCGRPVTYDAIHTELAHA